ncbi:MAG: hypothetical protein GY842_04600, partial [bacterium]|nr:hypothetical protein [bacterium]
MEVSRQVREESGHKCAVCGESDPLEMAHIIPWAKSHDHQPGNLVCLCSNCHGRADKDPKKWGAKVLRWYKEHPWVHHKGREQPPQEAVVDARPAGPRHNLPFASLGRLFKGRDKVLDALGAGVGVAEAIAIVQPVAVSGLGGIGKSRLAVEYGWRCVADGRTVLWVTAD